jgi:hypothetical protein
METRYEVERVPIGRRRDRRVPTLVVALAVLLAVLLVKPWVGPSASPSLGPARPHPTTVADAGPLEPGVARASGWPAAATPARFDATAATQAETAIGRLSAYSGTWGVGNSGVGPRLLRDEPWMDWAAVTPEAAGDAPSHVGTWPGTPVCEGLATIYDRPSLVAITVPSEAVPDWRVAGWWTDGANVAPLTGSIRQVSPAGDRGVSYLERTDRAPWPAGRYEFHVITGATTVSLTICLTRRG